jgi:hypothetical protein
MIPNIAMKYVNHVYPDNVEPIPAYDDINGSVPDDKVI